MPRQRGDITSGDVRTNRIVRADSPIEGEYRRDVGETAGGEKPNYQQATLDPAVLQQPDRLIPQDEADRLLDACQAVARRARDAFKEACTATNVDDAEASFLSVKHKLDELWGYARLRDRHFRDLLSLVTTAIKKTELSAITPVQRDVLRQAFIDLPRLFLDDAVVEQHIDRFAEHAIDQVLAPIQAPKGKRLKITIEEID